VRFVTHYKATARAYRFLEVFGARAKNDLMAFHLAVGKLDGDVREIGSVEPADWKDQ